ncbi:hypothetical protein LXA43DRAFT_1067435 [Ganoderma leucocontextum]|nr:hypothetical protein LXA43DRAFT_1067435 [Ganoderma leucocontextum]
MDHSNVAAELVAEYNSILIENHCAHAAAVVFIYEYFITVSEEAKYFWNRKMTGASTLFFLNRYVPLTWYALQLASYASMSNQLCLVFKIPFCLRSLAVPVTRYGVTGENIPFAGCVEDDFTPPDVAKRLLILITWSSLFRKGAFRLTFGTATFAEVLLRDGTIYFVFGILLHVLLLPFPLNLPNLRVLVVLNALHLAFSLASFAIPSLQNVSDLSLFTESITAILMQRFLFHLQSANWRALDLDSSQFGGAVTQQSSSLVFNRFIGSLGASIPSEDFLGTPEDDMVEDEQEGGTGSTSEETRT